MKPTSEQLDLFKLKKSLQYEYDSLLDEHKVMSNASQLQFLKEQLFILNKYNFDLSEFKPQFNSHHQDVCKIGFAIPDRRNLKINDRVYVNIPEDAGEWSVYKNNLFLKEGTIKDIQIEETNHVNLEIHFDDGTVEILPSDYMNKK